MLTFFGRKAKLHKALETLANEFTPCGIVPSFGLLVVRNGRIVGSVGLQEDEVNKIIGAKMIPVPEKPEDPDRDYRTYKTCKGGNHTK